MAVPTERLERMMAVATDRRQCLSLASLALRSSCLRPLPPARHCIPFSPSACPGRLKLCAAATRRARPSLPPLLCSREEDNLQPSEFQPHKDDKSSTDFFVKWEVPWDGKTVISTATAFGLSLQTIVGTSVIKACLKSYIPFPNDLFNYDWRDPFNRSRGWLLWSIVGIFCATAAVLLAGSLMTFINGEPLPREGQDALLQLLPLIGASSTSTGLLLAVTGILAPYLEETVFRGFLMTSLTKWVPTYVAVFLSAGAFALAHFTPGEIPQLFSLGVVLGFSYSKTGNLLTPIVIHGLWNSGVLLLLTFLRLQGYDIQELI